MSGDLISRSALFDCFEKEYKQSNYPYFHIDEVTDIIIHAPAVDAVPVVHGRWIEDRWTKWQCDKCHSPSPAYGYPRMEYVKTKYCPNCVAKMDGGEDDA